MGRPTVVLLVLLAAVGSWFFFNELPLDGGLTGKPSGGLRFFAAPQQPGKPPLASHRPVLRVATFNIDHFDQAKSQSPDILASLARIISKFDVVALQDIRAREQNVITRLVDQINRGGRQFDYVLGPRVGRFDDKEQFAFVFNRTSVDIDRFELYTVKDPDDLLRSEPFVAWFRARGPEPSEAFTFSLVNMHVDPREAARETALLRAIFQSVRNDRRGEDDVILLGDFQTNVDNLQTAAQMPSAVFTVAESATNPQQTEQVNNIVFDRHATVEFTGRSGVLDFLRELNLTMEQAVLVSNHLPAWAEFSVYEGGDPSRLAAADPGEFQPAR